MPPVTETPSLRRTFGHYPSGVAAISAEIDGTAHVLVSSSFTVGVSLEPPLVMFAVQHSSQTWPLLKSATRLGVSVLSSEQEALCRQLASADRSARFHGVDLLPTDSDAVLLGGASVWLQCSVFGEHRAGDHDVVVLRIHDHDADFGAEPLVFHGSTFRGLG
ncbi:flavin reductase family protein [Gordonia terrae]